jgi:short-subunit dehydrogenase
MSKHVFISGASGFIGRHLCLHLVNNGCKVYALIRQNDDYLNSIGVRTWIGDLWDKNILKLALNDIEIVIHCAGDPSFGDGAQYYHANVGLTIHLIETIKSVVPSLERFVFVSSIGAIDRSSNDNCKEALNECSIPSPSSDYGRSKLQAESIVRRSNLPYSIIRPAMVVGFDMRFNSHFAVFSRKALSFSIFSRIAWPGKFSVVHVDDLVSAIWLVSTHRSALNQIFFCSGDTISIADCFSQSCPNVKRISISWIASALRPFIRWLPFAIKAMLFPALTASDKPLRKIGWQPQHDGSSVLLALILREAARINPEVDPGGQTVITGAASGLARALLERLAPIRQQILLIDKNENTLLSIASKYPNCRIMVVDLALETELDLLYKSAEWNKYPITELFACAGIGLRGEFQTHSFESLKKIFDVNVLSRIFLAKNVIESMRRLQFGRIIFISSSSAFQPLPFMGAYAASNSALLSLGEAWSSEVAHQGIQFKVICPGGMQTNFQKSAGVREIQGEALMSPTRVAKEIFLSLKNQRITVIVSFRSFVMSLLARILPRRLSLKLWKFLMERMR